MFSERTEDSCSPVKSYSETEDPARWHLMHCAVVPGYPFKSRVPYSERLISHSYKHVDCKIARKEGTYSDFTMPIHIYYFDSAFVRQRIYFHHNHTFSALYNHSMFVRMHVHNAWLLKADKLDILLPELFFETADHLFLFCGTFQVRGLCEDFEITNFDFVNLLFAASYLLIDDAFFVTILDKCRIYKHTDSSSCLRMLYALLTLDFNYPETLRFVASWFPNYDDGLVREFSTLPFQEFKNRMRMLTRHNQYFQRFFYKDFFGATPDESRRCRICSAKNCIHKNTEFLDVYKGQGVDVARNLRLYSSQVDDYDDDDDIFRTSMFDKCEHICGNRCCPPSKEVRNICNVYFRDVKAYKYYTELNEKGRHIYIQTHIAHNTLKLRAYDTVYVNLKILLSKKEIKELVGTWGPTQLKMVILGNQPIRPNELPRGLTFSIIKELFGIKSYFPKPTARQFQLYPNKYSAYINE